MTQSQRTPADAPPAIQPRSAAYYRNSADDEQEDSIATQRERIREWADDHDIEIVREFADGGSLPDDSQAE